MEKKAQLKIFGQSITPFGPLLLDKSIGRLFGLKGDFVPDFRLIDYLVALMSTDESPALDGNLGNEVRLKSDLADLGIFDPNMSLYLLYKLRDFSSRGFSGFEGRHYSLFESISSDMGEATNLQVLVTALAYKYILQGGITHSDIPDHPSVESERRQIFFGTAIGIPTFFVLKNTKNQFMKKILKTAKGTRLSHRYPGYLRVQNLEYRKALIETIKEDAADLIQAMSLHNTIDDLEERIENPFKYSACGKITHGILESTHVANAMKLDGHDFNSAAEAYYRNALRIKHMKEAFIFLEEDICKLDLFAACNGGTNREILSSILGKTNPAELIKTARNEILAETVSAETLRKLIHLTLFTIQNDIHHHQINVEQTTYHEKYAASIY